MMPTCCNVFHVGWICPRCARPMTIKPHSGNDPVPVSKLVPSKIEQSVTVVHGDYVQGSVIKDSVVMGSVGTETKPEGDLDISGKVVPGSNIQDSIVISDSDLDL